MTARAAAREGRGISARAFALARPRVAPSLLATRRTVLFGRTADDVAHATLLPTNASIRYTCPNACFGPQIKFLSTAQIKFFLILVTMSLSIRCLHFELVS